ncbi:MAG: hypothetical protein AB3A66_10245 [Nodularia sp. CChRGM 3473]
MMKPLPPRSGLGTLNASVGGLNGAGAAIAYKFSEQLQLNVGYIADNNQVNIFCGIYRN